MIRKIFKWEFWPHWLFYLPVYVVYLWYSIRAGTMMFFTAVNPSMYMSGFIEYSKYDILNKLPQQIIPQSFLINSSMDYQAIDKLLSNNNLSFPLIVKPNKGQRGFEVEKVNDQHELKQYLSTHKTELLLQEYIDYELEYGVMYYKDPGINKGVISSIVRKEFLIVEGDGVSPLSNLIKKSPRGKFYKKLLFKKFRTELDLVLKFGEPKKLVEIGNHCKGATFYNANSLINDKLIQVFDNICDGIEGFNFGRFDLRVESLDKLYSGDFKVVELNGVNSEPAHIYDPKMPLHKAYSAMFKHWKTIYKIGTYNHKIGIEYMSFKEAYKKTRQHFKRRKREIITS